MFSQRAAQLDTNARLLLQQAVMNPSLQQLFMLEKVEVQQQLLASFQVADETDAQYLRKLEIQRHRILFIDEILAFFETEKSEFQN